MSHLGRRAALLSACIAVVSLGSPAWAEEDEVEAAPPPANAPIIVTGKIPRYGDIAYAGSADAIEADELDARQFQDLSTLSYASPNVSLDPIGTFKGVANFATRGLGINSSIPSIDPAVGLFVDGVYMGINAGTVFDALDVERVDILRGPQGVAFGRNTTGGAIMVQTGDPTWDWEGHARASYEGPVDGGRGAGMFSLRGVVSGPLSESVAIRLGALHSSDTGYFENSFDGSNYGAAETTVLRGALKLLASDALTLTLKGEWTNSSGDGATTHNNGQHARDNFEISVNQPGSYDSESGFFTARGDLELGPGTLTDLFGWRSYDLSTRNDIDSSPTKLFESDTGTSQEQWSNELYYAADIGFLTVTLGGYIFHQDIGYDETRDLTGLGVGTIYYGGGRQGHEVYGLYAQADYDLTEQLTLSAGLRWSREEKDAAVTYVRPRAACSAIAATCPTTGENAPGENNGFTDSRAWESLAPRVALAFSPTRDASLYASWTRGYRSGGYNLRITQPAAFEEVSTALGSPAFDEEKVDTYEIGARWRSPDGMAQISAAGYLTEVDNLQRELNLPSQSSGLAQSVYNTADARITGAEIEASFMPARGLTVSANLGLTDADYTDVFFDLNSDNVIDAKDLALELPRAPKSTWGGSVQYEAPVGIGALAFNAFFQHRARYAYTDNNWGFNSASDRFDSSISLKLDDPNVTLTLFGRNLLDEVQFGGDTQLPFAGGTYSNGVNAPFDPSPAAGTFSPVAKGRIMGVELAADF